ncbi:flagellar hook-basal body complex protein FliE [Glaciimonas sp. PAMC28666]|uniref:flagellar hook-basal body complex protein FliE n=1 Tax=Glaciimonas sp. PAMC28666 TaxID=2807626 RepID=UPI00196516C0|nr:flagellar hook-basal body complex protein FliE [Glaciimonas sp. PAMC28666]QRX83158.1 flagellar hook-basal body complex protein FliE [Glaciimonas sp. PAMC28666]
MTISAIQSVLQQLQTTALSASSLAGPAEGVAAGGFSDELRKSLDRISDSQQHAYGQAESFELGKPGVALNDVMVDLQKANIDFQMGLQVRNKLVSAYQDVMNMSV